jgi:beta-lactamase class C
MIFPVLLVALARRSVADIGMDAKVQHIVTAYLAPETVGKAGGLAVAVYAAGYAQFFNYGVADELTKRPITSDTLFNVASVRKPFEAILVALGTLRGELSLDDPVSRYVPELRGDYIKSVTIGEQAACRRPETTRQL